MLGMGFLDFQGEATGRGGRSCRILGIKRPLSKERVPLRVRKPNAKPETVHFQGYRRDAMTGDPTFMFAIDGIAIEQRVSSPASDQITLKLHFPEALTQAAYYHLNPKAHAKVDLATHLRWSEPGIIEIPAGASEAEVTITLKPTDKTFKRKAPDLTGAQVFQFYCNACHSTDGSRLIGPSFKGLWDRQQTVTRNGKTETLKVDETYVLESITQPQAAIVKGYEAIPMADFTSMITKEQMTRLMEHLKTIE